MIEANWADLWRRLDRPGDPPAPGPLLDVLAAAALVQPERHPAGLRRAAMARRRGRFCTGYIPVLPLVFSAAAAPGVRAAVDTELGAFWVAIGLVSGAAAGGRGGHRHWPRARRAGRRAVPAAARPACDTASTLLEQAARTRRVAGRGRGAALPPLRSISLRSPRRPRWYSVLARVLSTVPRPGRGRAAAPRHYRCRRLGAVDFRAASAAAGDLVNLLGRAGRRGEALEVAGPGGRVCPGRPSSGPRTQLADRGAAAADPGPDGRA